MRLGCSFWRPRGRGGKERHCALKDGPPAAPGHTIVTPAALPPGPDPPPAHRPLDCPPHSRPAAPRGLAAAPCHWAPSHSSSSQHAAQSQAYYDATHRECWGGLAALRLGTCRAAMRAWQHCCGRQAACPWRPGGLGSSRPLPPLGRLLLPPLPAAEPDLQVSAESAENSDMAVRADRPADRGAHHCEREPPARRRRSAPPLFPACPCLQLRLPPLIMLTDPSPLCNVCCRGLMST